MLLHVFSVFRARGFTRAALGVDARSPTGANRLYERRDACGARFERTRSSSEPAARSLSGLPHADRGRRRTEYECHSCGRRSGRPRARAPSVGQRRGGDGRSGGACPSVSGGRGGRGGLAARAVPRARARAAGAAARPRRLLLLARRRRRGARGASRAHRRRLDRRARRPEHAGQSPSGNTWGMPLRMLLDAARRGRGHRARRRSQPRPTRDGVHRRARPGPEREGSTRATGRPLASTSRSTATRWTRRGRSFMPEPDGLSLAEDVEAVLVRSGPASPVLGAGFTGLRADERNVDPADAACAVQRVCRPPAMVETGTEGDTRLRPCRAGRGVDRAQARARAGRRREAASEHVPALWLALPRRRARRSSFACARSAATTSRSTRSSAWRSSPIRARSTRRPRTSAPSDPLGFFDLRPYTERLAEAELSTGLGEAIVIGRATIDGRPCQLAVMDFSFMGGSMGSVVGEKFALACEARPSAGCRSSA